MRGLILDTLPIYYEVKKERKEDEVKSLAGFKPTTSLVSASAECALPLCYMRCPKEFLRIVCWVYFTARTIPFNENSHPHLPCFMF